MLFGTLFTVRDVGTASLTRVGDVPLETSGTCGVEGARNGLGDVEGGAQF